MASQNVNPMFTGGDNSSKMSGTCETARKDSHSVTKRLKQELMSLMMSSDQSVSAFPDGDNLFHWIGTITGPRATVYEGLQYKLSLTFPSSYPYTAPTVKFDTPCYHPNVDQHGNICLDTLKEKWTALLEVRTILLSIQSLLGEPNVDSPLNTHAARLWSDQQAYKAVLLQKYEAEVKGKTF